MAQPVESPPDAGPGAPRPGVTTVAAGRVRTVVTEGRRPLFAACRADERLTGGGCQLPGATTGSVRPSYPSHVGRDDTLGAGWNCQLESQYSSLPMRAHAMCQVVPSP